MSANETLDLDAIERAIGSLERGPRITVNGTDFAIIHARRLIAAVRERDAEIERLTRERDARLPLTVAGVLDVYRESEHVGPAVFRAWLLDLYRREAQP